MLLWHQKQIQHLWGHRFKTHKQGESTETMTEKQDTKYLIIQEFLG